MTGMTGHWFPIEHPFRDKVPAELWSWVAETGSLTQRLKRACAAEFSLVVLAERDGAMDRDDAAVMGIAMGEPARVREVELRCGGRACIAARSVLPHATLAGAGRELAALGARPLGDALFAHADMVRGPIELTDVPTWGRRSVFRLSGEPVLVAEWFLPGLLECAR
jgi:chorismate lyase